MGENRGLTGTQLSMGREHTALARSHSDLFTGSLGRSIFTDQELTALNVIMIKCGTPEGYRQHQREGDLPCGKCHRAVEQGSDLPTVPRDCCGTNEGWMAHRWRNETPCDFCAVARKQHEDDFCGTYAGWMIHRRMGTTVCEGCRLARNSYQNNRPRKSRAKA